MGRKYDVIVLWLCSLNIIGAAGLLHSYDWQVIELTLFTQHCLICFSFQVEVDYSEADYSISNYPLSAALTCAKLCDAAEAVWGIFWERGRESERERERVCVCVYVCVWVILPGYECRCVCGKKDDHACVSLDLSKNPFRDKLMVFLDLILKNK